MAPKNVKVVRKSSCNRADLSSPRAILGGEAGTNVTFGPSAISRTADQQVPPFESPSPHVLSCDSFRRGARMRECHELRLLIAEVLEVPVDDFDDEGWLTGDLDTESVMDVAAAIEHRYGIRFTEPQLVELTSVADFMAVTAASAPRGRQQVA